MARLGKPRNQQTLASIVYRSVGAYHKEDVDLAGLLRRARRQNALLGVTGVLVYDGGRFFQCVEGSEAALTTVLNRIRGDPSHTRIEILARHEIPSRLFPGWHMNLARRKEQPALLLDGLLLAEGVLLDGLHGNDVGVQVSLAALSVGAWDARSATGGRADITDRF